MKSVAVGWTETVSLRETLSDLVVDRSAIPRRCWAKLFRSPPHPCHIYTLLPFRPDSLHPSRPPSLRPMSNKRPTGDDDVTDDEDARSIDPELRLRTVRTAASTLAESAAVEQRAEKRRTLLMHRKKKGSFFRRVSDRKRPAPDSVAPAAPVIHGQRRTIYVNRPLPMSEVDSKNEPLVRYPRNKVRTTSELSSLSPTHLPKPYASSRIYHPHVYTKEPVRAIS